MSTVKLGKRLVGPGQQPYIIAEIGSNHNGDMDLCRQLIEAAKKTGADAVKFQSWDTKSLIAQELYDKHLDYPGDKKRHFGSLYEMVEKYQFTPRQHREMAAYCKKVGITFSSTPFSLPEVDLLESLQVPFFKIASMDVTNHALLSYVAKKGKPVFLAVGMATLSEIALAMEILQPSVPVILMHCLAIYPPKYEDIRLKNIISLSQMFGVPVGFSDHTKGTAIPIAAVAIGAVAIEKHFTLDKEMDGWDHGISADPREMTAIVEQSRQVVAALGGYERVVVPAEIEKKKEFRRSIIMTKKKASGSIIKADDITFKRPEEGGISPMKYKDIIGRTLKRSVVSDQKLTWDDLL